MRITRIMRPLDGRGSDPVSDIRRIRIQPFQDKPDFGSMIFSELDPDPGKNKHIRIQVSDFEYEIVSVFNFIS